MIPRTLLNRIFPAIKPLERHLLERLTFELVPEARQILQGQIASINMVQRHTNCKEVCFYRMKWGKPTADSRQAFPLNVREIKLASAVFTVPGSSTVFRVDFWLVQGLLFSMTFDHSPKEWLNQTNVQIDKMDICHDPLITIPEIEKNKTHVRLSSWVADWNIQHSFSNLSTPLSLEDQQRFRADISSTLPQDYLELIAQTEGVTIGPCTVNGLSEIRQVVLSDATYFVLAEIQNFGAIGVKDGATDAMLYTSDYNSNTPSLSGSSFRFAIDRFLNESVSSSLRR